MKRTGSSGGRGKRTRRMVRLAALGATLVASSSGVTRAAELPTGPAIVQQMRTFNTMGSVQEADRGLRATPYRVAASTSFQTVRMSAARSTIG